METIRLGDIVQCKYTGLKGVTMSKTEFINGCVQFGVSPKWDKKLAPTIETFTEINVDSQSLNIIKKGERWRNPERDAEMLDALEDEPTGGPMRRAPKMRGK